MKVKDVIYTDTTKMTCCVSECRKSHKHMVEIATKKEKILLCQSCYIKITRELEREKQIDSKD